MRNGWFTANQASENWSKADQLYQQHLMTCRECFVHVKCAEHDRLKEQYERFTEREFRRFE